MEKLIPRIITNDLKDILEYFPVLGIIGPRQVGKTTLAQQLLHYLDKEALYLDMENPEDVAKLSEPTLYFRKNKDKCIILDEIQRKPDIFPVLRSIIDENRMPARFILTGSASPEMIRDSSESLAGRIAYKELTPFNVMEIINNKDIEQHWLRGGFPLSYLAPSDKMAKIWLESFIQTYIEKDLPLLGLQVSPTVLRNLWSMLAHIQGSVLNMSLLSKSLELSVPSLKKYIHFLSEAFLVRILEPYYLNIKKRLVKSPKIYIRDSGILHTILGIQSQDQLDGNPVRGMSWEGYIVEQIYLHVKDVYGIYFYRTHQGAECDLVLTKAHKPIICIEIKYTAVPKVTKGLVTSIEDLKTSNNYIVCKTDEDFPIASNITACNLVSLLKYHLVS